VGKQLDLSLLHILFIGLGCLSGLLHVVIHLLEFSQTLFNGGVQLHCILCRVLQGLLQISNLSGKLALGTLVLGVFLLDFRQVLELDGLPLVDSAFHLLDHLVLLLEELLMAKLHPVDFFLHCHYFLLTDVGIESVLHFLLKLDLSLPKKNLSFCFHDFSKNVRLLLL